MGFDQATVSAIELDTYPPTHKFVYAVAKAWDMDADVLLTKAGLAAEPIPVNEQSRAELLAIFDRLDEADQLRLIEHAKALRTATQKLNRAHGNSPKRSR